MDLLSVARKEGTAFEIRVRGQAVRVDMAPKDGGGGTAPSPVELLAGSLGACIAMMVQRYCDAHGWRDGDVGVDLTMELADNPKRVSAFTVDLRIPKDVPEDRKEAVRRVAEFCPVHETLKHLPRLDLEIV